MALYSSVENVQTKKNDRTDIVFNVQEKQTGQFSVGGGFSSTDGALANVGISEKNFLGKGQDLTLKFTVAERATQLDFGFTEPYFRGKDIALGLDLFKSKVTYADESSFDNDSLGGGVRFGYMLTERTRHSWNFSYKGETIQGVKVGASDFITSQKGDYTTSQLSHHLTYYGLNDRLNPTKGSRLRISNSLAGLGGNVNYFKSDIGTSWFRSVTDEYVFSMHFKGGYIFGYNDKKVKLKDRYFLGGDSFAGFQTAGIGPRDSSSANKDALGANMMYTLKTELRVPIPGIAPQLGINGVFFGVVGTATEIDEDGGDKIKDDSSPRISAGFGVQWKSPFGPVRVDFAHAVMKEDYDQTQFLKFNFGAGF